MISASPFDRLLPGVSASKGFAWRSYCFKTALFACFFLCQGRDEPHSPIYSIPPSFHSKEVINAVEALPARMEEAVKISFYNILTTYVTDQKEKVYQNFPQFRWENRKNAIVELIAEDHPTVLGLCELDLKQIKTLQSEMKPGGRLEGYRLVGYSSETGKAIEPSLEEFGEEEHRLYGEFVALLYDGRRLALQKSTSFPLPHFAEQRWHRILVEALFLDRATHITFACLVSHFDHENPAARKASAAFEIERIRAFEQEGTPWFSLADRNWRQEEMEELAAIYLKERYACDFREESELGSFGPPGTFPAHPWLEQEFNVLQSDEEGPILDAWTLDVGYRSKTLCRELFYYAKTGEFNPETGHLLKAEEKGDMMKRNFASDHYLFGGVFFLLK